MPHFDYELVRDDEPNRTVTVVYKRHKGYAAWQDAGDPGEPGEDDSIEIVDVIDANGESVDLTDGEDSEILDTIEFRRRGY